MAVKGKQFKMQVLKSELIFTEHTAFINQPLFFILVIYGCIAILVPIIALIKDGALLLLPLFVLLSMPLILLIILISICRISVLVTDESIYLKLYPVQFKYRKIPLNSIERISLVEDVFKFHFNFPPIATIIATNQPLRLLVRLLLTPVIAIVYMIYHPFLIGTVLFIFWGEPN